MALVQPLPTLHLIEINPIPVADAGLDIQTCSMAPGQLGADPVPGYSYVWSPNRFTQLSIHCQSAGNCRKHWRTDWMK
ncbi:MAG: hypothetical protein R2850_10755 [Bacteroidia bacterium]